MGYRNLVPPVNIHIDFKPSPKQYELWKALQPECHICGGEIKNVCIGTDEFGHERYVPECSKCGNRNIPQMVLGGGAAGGGKAQPYWSKVLTPSGWVQMGELKVGDEVVTPNNGTAKIIAIHEQGHVPTSVVQFNDNTRVHCNKEHLWKIKASYFGGAFHKDYTVEKIVTTEKLGDMLRGTSIKVPVNDPLEFGKPYDGLVQPYSIGEFVALRETWDYTQQNRSRFYRIPEGIIYGSLEDRQDLVRGLYKNGAFIHTEKGYYDFYSKDPDLCEDIAQVMRSLGHIAKVSYLKAKFKHRVRCTINPNHRYIFPRNNGPEPKFIRRVVNVVHEVDTDKQRCITLDSDEQLYITDNYTVTHNSYLGSAWLVSSCIRFPNIRAVVARKTIKSLKESTFVTIKKVMKEWGLIEDVNYSINNIEGSITFWNESVIMMKEMADLPGDSDFSRFGSMEATIVFVDEASEISERAADVMYSRIRWRTHETFKTPKMFMSCNPAACWLRDRFVQDTEGNPIVPRDGEMFVRFSIFDNPDEKFRQIYEASLNKIKDNATRERLLYGNWDFVESNSMALYRAFDGEKHLVSNLKGKVYDLMKPLILGFDFNVFPFMTCLVCQVDYDTRGFYVLEELLGKPDDKLNNTPQFAKFVRDYLLEQKHAGGIVVTGDPAGLARNTMTEEGVNNYSILLSTFQQSQVLRADLRLLQKQPSQKNRTEWINELFGGRDGWKISIDLKCRKLTEDLIYQLRNEDGTKNKQKVTDPYTKVKYEKYGHCSDAFDYILCTFLSESWKRYQRGSSGGKIVTTSTIQPKFAF